METDDATGSAEQESSSKPEKRSIKRPVASGAAVPEGVPLVALQPALPYQVPGRELKAGPASASVQACQGHKVLRPTARRAYSPCSAEASLAIQARHSTPGREKENLSHELRGSKSAPDLRAPVLAAIRGLQDGSLKVDLPTRAKIANAARKVLQTREQRRRNRAEPYYISGSAKTAQQHSIAQQANLESSPSLRLLPRETAYPGNNSKIGHLVSTQHLKGSATQADLKKEASKVEQGVEKAAVIGGFAPKPTSEQTRKFPCTVTTGMPKIAQGVGAREGTQPELSPSRNSHMRSRSPALQPASRTNLAEVLGLASEKQPVQESQGPDTTCP